MPLLQVLLSLTTFVTNYATIANKKTELEEIQANDTNNDLSDIFTKLFSIIDGENTYTLDEVKSDINTKFNNEVTSSAETKDESKPYVEGVVPATPGYKNISVFDGPIANSDVGFGAGQTDSAGHATLSVGTIAAAAVVDAAAAVLSATSGTVMDTGRSSTTTTAPSDSQTINPITSLIGLNGSNPSAAQVLSALGLSTDIDLFTFNPYLASDPNTPANKLAGAKVASQLATIALIASDDADVQNAVFAAIKELIKPGVTLDLADEDTIKSIYAAAKITDNNDAKATNASKTNQAISEATSLDEVGKAQGQGLNMVANGLSADTKIDSKEAINQSTNLAAGDSATGSTSDQTSGTSGDLIAPVLTTISMTSTNKKDNKFAKEDDIVTLTMVANENIQKPVVTFTIGGVNKEPNVQPKVQGNKKDWTATYTVETELNGVVGFTINYKDIAGNDGIPRSSVTTGKAVTIDTKAPVITVTGDNPATVEKGSDYDDAGATANEGTVTSSGTVDTDTVGRYTITYSATDSAGNTGTATRTVNVVDTEPIIDTSNVVITIYDGETELGTANADRAVSWSIDDSETDPSNIDVNIDGSSGVITLSKPIDYDTNTSFKYVITATEADNSGDVVNTTVNVTVKDLIKIDDILTVKEGEQTIGTVTTYNDEIDVTWTIEGTDASLVSVDGSSGVITLDSSANIETDSSYSFVVVATYNDNSANIAKKDVSVTVIDTEPIIDTSNVVITIYDGETELGTANADRAVSWSIDDSETDPSNIDVNIDGSSGVITLSKPIDYDTNTSFKYVITATEADNSGDVVNTTVNVTVKDLIKIDDILTVKEGEQTIGTVTTYNDEIDVTWSIEGTDASLVNVDSSSGVITLDSSANIETDSSYSFVVVATYVDNSANVAKKDLAVTVTE